MKEAKRRQKDKRRTKEGKERKKPKEGKESKKSKDGKERKVCESIGVNKEGKKKKESYSR